MSRQYKRVYNLLIQNDTTSLAIADLRITFEIAKTLRGYPNLAKINIYNLSRESRTKIQSEFDQLILNAGYDGNVKTLFVGAIKNVTHTRAGQDLITTIYAADGQQDFEQSFSSFTLAEGATLGDILNTVIEDFGETTLGLIEGVDLEQDKLQGYSASKPSKKILDELAAEYNFDWTIEQGVLKIIDGDSFENVEFEISAATGMINSPAITEIGADVSFLLNPEVLPGRVINIVATAANVTIANLQFRDSATVRTEATGRYRVIKVDHRGDTHADDWSSTVVGELLR